MQAIPTATNTVPMIVMQRHEQLPNNEDKTSQIGPKVLQEMDSQDEVETILGSEEKLRLLSSFDSAAPDLRQQIHANKKERKKFRKCKCIAKGATIGTGTCATGFGLGAWACAIAACVTGSPTLLEYFALTWVCGSGPCAFATMGNYYVWSRQGRLIDELEKDNITLKEAINKIKDSEYIAFIDSQAYENLEDLLILPDFHRYVDVCILLQKSWELEKSERHPSSTQTLEDQLMLREKEEELAYALFKKLDGHFKRFDITKEE